MNISPKPTIANWNGSILPLDEVMIPATDRGFLFADSIYEVMRLIRGKVWLIEDHFARLENSLRGVRMHTDLAQLRSKITDTIQASGLSSGLIYIQITRGSAPRKHRFPDVPTNELIYVQDYDDSVSQKYQTEGISVMLAPDERWQRRDLKTTNLLPNCLANDAAFAKGFQECLLVDRDGFINEATHSNFFAVMDGKLYTAPADHKILSGITRKLVLRLAHELKIPIVEKAIHQNEIPKLQEAFLTGTMTTVAPITRIDNLILTLKLDQRPITQAILTEYKRSLVAPT